MKTTKVLIPLIGVLLIGAMVLQTKVFSANAAMGTLETIKTHASTFRPSKTAPTELAMTNGDYITAEGRVSTYPGAHVVVGTDTAGTLVRLLVQEKSTVRKGQVIGEIRAEDTRAALDLSRTRMSELDSDIRLYEAELLRASHLYDQAVGTKQNVDRARRDLDSAIARRDSAAAEVNRIQAVLGKTLILSPISGTVLERLAQPGESLKEQAAVASIADLKKMRIEAEVDEFDAGRVKLGSEVIVRAEGYDHQQWRGRVEEIPDAVVARRLKPEDPGRPTDTRVLLVKVALEESTPLKLGQRVEVEIKK
jgi:HlyD family secretion protein